MGAVRWLKRAVRRAARPVAIGAAALLVAAAATAGVLDLGFARDVLVIAPKAPDVVAIERAMWQPGDPVAAIYGIAADQPTRVLFVDEARILRPPEDPSLALLPVDKQIGDNPVQTKTVWFVTIRAAVGLLALAALATLLHYRSRRWAIA